MKPFHRSVVALSAAALITMLGLAGSTAGASNNYASSSPKIKQIQAAVAAANERPEGCRS